MLGNKLASLKCHFAMKGEFGSYLATFEIGGLARALPLVIAKSWSRHVTQPPLMVTAEVTNAQRG